MTTCSGWTRADAAPGTDRGAAASAGAEAGLARRANPAGVRRALRPVRPARPACRPAHRKRASARLPGRWAAAARPAVRPGRTRPPSGLRRPRGFRRLRRSRGATSGDRASGDGKVRRPGGAVPRLHRDGRPGRAAHLPQPSRPGAGRVDQPERGLLEDPRRLPHRGGASNRGRGRAAGGAVGWALDRRKRAAALTVCGANRRRRELLSRDPPGHRGAAGPGHRAARYAGTPTGDRGAA